MNIKRIYYLMGVTVVVAIVTAGTVAAQEQNDDDTMVTSRFIQRYDQDGDGLVSLDEFPSAKERFDHLNANGDDYIDATEAPKRHQRGKRQKDRMMTRFDADNDGKLSMGEFPGPDGHFAQLDTDADGYLSKQEMHQMHRRKDLRRYDADGDGRVSKEEFSGPDEVFARLDENGDGYIQLGEGRQGSPRKQPVDLPDEE